MALIPLLALKPKVVSLFATTAQLNRLLGESLGALEWAARERKCHRHRLAASELAALRKDVSGPGVRRAIARARVEERAESEDGGVSAVPDLLAGVYKRSRESPLLQV